jgi:hypothetical protein
MINPTNSRQELSTYKLDAQGSFSSFSAGCSVVGIGNNEYLVVHYKGQFKVNVASQSVTAAYPDVVLANVAQSPLRSNSLIPMPDGKVLVAGLNAVVLDPATGATTVVGTSWGKASLIPREGSLWTRLSDGKYLVTGGATGRYIGQDYGWMRDAKPSNVAEIFDPATGEFKLIQAMVHSYYLHTATMLNNGKVLIAGGLTSEIDQHGQSSLVASGFAELFDPGNNTFASTAGPLRTERFSHAAVKLSDGRVLIVGGAPDCGVYYCTAKWRKDQHIGVSSAGLNSAEMYDENSGLFYQMSSKMTYPRSGVIAIALGSNAVLIVGGENIPLGGADIAGLREVFTYTPNTFFVH